MSRGSTVPLTALVTAVALAGCSSGGSAVRTVAQRNANAAGVLTRSADTLPDGSALLRAPAQRQLVLPPGAVARAPTSVEEATVALLQPHADDLSDDDLLQALGAACTAKDYVQLGTASSLPQAVEQAIAVLDVGDTPASRVQGLAEDLRDAETSTDVARSLAEFTLCDATAQPR